jgi:hypothetical protein
MEKLIVSTKIHRILEKHTDRITKEIAQVIVDSVNFNSKCGNL